MLMHIVTCSNCFDLNKTVSLRMGVSEKRLVLFANFHTDSRVICPFRLCKIFQCWINQENFSHALDRVDYENKTQMQSIQFFIDACPRAQGLLLIGRKGMHYAQLKFTSILDRTLFSYANYPRKHADIFKTFFCLEKFFTSLHFTLVDKLTDYFNAE